MLLILQISHGAGDHKSQAIQPILMEDSRETLQSSCPAGCHTIRASTWPLMLSVLPLHKCCFNPCARPSVAAESILSPVRVCRVSVNTHCGGNIPFFLSKDFFMFKSIIQRSSRRERKTPRNVFEQRWWAPQHVADDTQVQRQTAC